jgi:tetratricopeptide (TPR) repeat protein
MRFTFAFVLASLLSSATANAQAEPYFNTVQRGADAKERQRAEYQLALALQEQGLLIPALYYYKNVFLAGPQHPHLFDSIKALVSIATELKDDFIVPTIIASRYEQYFDQLSKLDSERAMRVNYMVGALDYRQGKYDTATESLSAVEGSLKAKARYLLGVISVRKSDNKAAIGRWNEVLELIPDGDLDEERASLRNTAILGIARAQYALGQYAESSATYATVPRFSKEWYDSLFESAWAYFQQEDYGRALGQVESVLSPYFNKRFRPEAFVLAATVYYSNCQFDRTRTLLDAFRGRYDSSLAMLQTYLKKDRQGTLVYQDIVHTSEDLPIDALRQIRRNGRFLNYHRIISEIDREQKNLALADNGQGRAMQSELDNILKEQRSELEEYTGRWLKAQWKLQAETLQTFINQARIIKLETATSEKEILEAGGSLAQAARKRLPRPAIPNDQSNHWNFRGEYWADEVGYYVHSVRKECSEVAPQ